MGSSSSSTGEGVGKKEIQNRGSFGFPIAKESTEFGFIRATQTSLSNQPASHCRCRQRYPEVHLWGVEGDLAPNSVAVSSDQVDSNESEHFTHRNLESTLSKYVLSCAHG